MKKIIEVTFGAGRGKTELAAFDSALFNAGVGNYNLLHLSSVIPTGCTPVIKKVDYNNNDEFGYKLFCVLSEKRESRIGHAAWAGLGWVLTVESPTQGLFVEHSGESEAEVMDAMTKTLTSIVEYREGKYGAIQYKTIGVICEKNPVCAAVIAIYETGKWEKGIALKHDPDT